MILSRRLLLIDILDDDVSVVIDDVVVVDPNRPVSSLRLDGTILVSFRNTGSVHVGMRNHRTITITAP
jgi:hypothetical protein